MLGRAPHRRSRTAVHLGQHVLVAAPEGFLYTEFSLSSENKKSGTAQTRDSSTYQVDIATPPGNPSVSQSCGPASEPMIRRRNDFVISDLRAVPAVHHVSHASPLAYEEAHAFSDPVVRILPCD
jgi:hypothetical protein